MRNGDQFGSPRRFAVPAASGTGSAYVGAELSGSPSSPRVLRSGVKRPQKKWQAVRMGHVVCVQQVRQACQPAGEECGESQPRRGFERGGHAEMQRACSEVVRGAARACR